MNFLRKNIFLSLFGAGFLPKMPGTWGSLFSLPLLYLLHFVLPEPLQVRISVLVLLFGALYFFSIHAISSEAEKGVIDHKWIVIDEFLGMYIALFPLFFLTDFSWVYALLSFLLFRYFDITKPLGISHIDARHNPSSVLLDDVLAGIYSLVLALISYFFLIPQAATYFVIP